MAARTLGLAWGLALGATLLAAAPAAAQPHQPISDSTIVPVSALDNTPHRDISNGQVSARVYLPGPAGFYRGTRFDHNGITTHATYQGQDYGRPWFSAYSPAVHDFTWHNGEVVVHPASAVAGPAEEFDSIGFDAAGMDGNFLKVGIGMLKRTTETEDHVHPYPIVNAGRTRVDADKSRVRITQTLADKPSGYGYRYTKTIRLVPGKAQMVIEHSLTNTGSKDIDTNVYCHNFLTLSPGNENITITAPFAITAERPFAPDAAAVDGKTIKYLRAVKEGESVTSPISGFGDSASDYDFTVMNTKTGFGQRIRGDQPLARINFWSIATNVSWEPYVGIALKPGETKRWTYTYDYIGPN
ncbi:MAG: hypothetical protein H6924_03300 [Alphaproteobacteria bacterium]|nr:hypothetical protein [Alphaproteobacteria bacterium]